MINNVRFNQDCSCFAVAHSRGFKVFNADPVESWVSRELGGGNGIYCATVLDRTNYLVLVCSNGPQGSPQNSAIVWNDLEETGQTLNFDSGVINVLVNRNAVVALLESEVHVLTLTFPHKTMAVFKTHSNPKGVAALTNTTLFVPGQHEGEIVVVDISAANATPTATLQCHRSAVHAIAANDRWLATASSTGTLIRVARLNTGEQVSENKGDEAPKFLRRGLDKANIWSLALSKSDKLAVLSDKGTLHVYGIGDHAANERHSLAKFPLAPKYFGDEWSSARVKTGSKDEAIVGWVADDACVIIKKNESLWEKYLLAENELVMESMKHIH